MKKIFLMFLLSIIYVNTSLAQTCVQSTVEEYLKKEGYSSTWAPKLWDSYFIIDMGTYRMIDPLSTHGLYAFGAFGDDVSEYILIQDRDSCHILRYESPSQNIKMMLDFMKKYAYPADLQIKYIENYLNVDLCYQDEAFRNNIRLRNKWKDRYNSEVENTVD